MIGVISDPRHTTRQLHKFLRMVCEILGQTAVVVGYSNNALGLQSSRAMRSQTRYVVLPFSALLIGEAWARAKTVKGLSFELSAPPKQHRLPFYVWHEPDAFFKDLKQVFSAGAIIIFGGVPMSGMDHSATVEQAEELVQLCRQGRLYQLDKCRKASGVAHD